MAQYEYELWQDGIVVASVIAATDEDALREIQHYAMVYGQDGPVEIHPVNRRASALRQEDEDGVA